MHRMLLLALLLGGPAHAGVVDRVVVVVEDEIVLASDVRIERMLTGLDPAPLPFWRLDHTTSEERLIMAALVRALAAGVTLYEPEDAAVRARMQALRARLGPAWADWLALTGLDEEAVYSLLRQRMEVEIYLARNLPEDPADTTRWQQACQELIDQVRGRFTVRTIAPRAGR